MVGRTHQKLGTQQSPRLLPKEAVNLWSLSEINSSGTPKNLTILSNKSIATEEALRAPYPTKQGIGLQYLVNVSTQVRIALYPIQKGSSMIKSILQDTNLFLRTGYVYNKVGLD